jgi:hypothetical protein
VVLVVFIHISPLQRVLFALAALLLGGFFVWLVRDLTAVVESVRQLTFRRERNLALKVSKRLRARVSERSLLCNVNGRLEVAVANNVGDACPRPIGFLVGKLQK